MQAAHTFAASTTRCMLCRWMSTCGPATTTAARFRCLVASGSTSTTTSACCCPTPARACCVATGSRSLASGPTPPPPAPATCTSAATSAASLSPSSRSWPACGLDTFRCSRPIGGSCAPSCTRCSRRTRSRRPRVTALSMAPCSTRSPTTPSRRRPSTRAPPSLRRSCASSVACVSSRLYWAATWSPSGSRARLSSIRAPTT